MSPTDEAPSAPGDSEAPGQVDLHSHLVPGVDDGARNLDDVEDGVGRMRDRGIRTIVTTPHLDGSLTLDADLLAHHLGRMDRAFERAASHVGREFPDVRFLRGHEIKLDCPDPDLSDPRLRLGGSNVVLVEWPGLQVPPETPRVLRALRVQGVDFLIAHVERYRGYDERLSVLERWREEGIFLQVNHGSLVGRYGNEIRRLAFRLLELGWVDCLASDFHGRPALRLYVGAARRLLKELDGEEAWSLLTEVNPARLLRGEEPLPVPPVRMERGMWKKLASLFR